MRTFQIYSQQLSKIQYTNVNYIHHAAYYIPRTYKLKLLLFDHFHIFPPSIIPISGNHQLVSVCMSLGFLDCTYKWDQRVFVFILYHLA